MLVDYSTSLVKDGEHLQLAIFYQPLQRKQWYIFD
jgi:hypothetical protein